MAAKAAAKKVVKRRRERKNVEKGAEHDPVFDCNRSIYSTWQMMRKLDFLKPIPIQQINNQQSTINNQ